MIKEYMMTIPSRQMIGAIRKQEIVRFKLAREMHNFYNGGENRGNVGIGNLSSYTKSFNCHFMTTFLGMKRE